MPTEHLFDLETFDDSELLHCRSDLQAVTVGAETMEEAAGIVVRYLFDRFRDSNGDRACPLVRLYKTHRFGSLEPALQSFALSAGGDSDIADSTRCLTLLATSGERPEWNDRTMSAGHRAIPLVSQALVEQLPMVSQLIRQFGIEIGTVVDSQLDLILELDQKTFNVFHVEVAQGSPHIPAQEDFVIPYGIRSVLGFGGALVTGDLFAVVLFSRVPITSEVARLFRTLSRTVKLAILPFAEEHVFAPAATS